LHSLTARMKQRMLEDGEMMISYQTNKWLPNFFRMIIVNPKVTHEHLDYVVSYLQDIGKELE
jgi:glutamate decarboxylase